MRPAAEFVTAAYRAPHRPGDGRRCAGLKGRVALRKLWGRACHRSRGCIKAGAEIRDFRLLIAIDVVRGFPDRVARRPERFAVSKGTSVADVKTKLQSVLVSELGTRKFSYTRSDGSVWTLSLKDVIDRASALEMAYNPNDCVELRWAAPEGSEEALTCKRHAPAAQRAKMIGYRSWFHERHWPHV
jgi:hypothetical protein